MLYIYIYIYFWQLLIRSEEYVDSVETVRMRLSETATVSKPEVA